MTRHIPAIHDGTARVLIKDPGLTAKLDAALAHNTATKAARLAIIDREASALGGRVGEVRGRPHGCGFIMREFDLLVPIGMRYGELDGMEHQARKAWITEKAAPVLARITAVNEAAPKRGRHRLKAYAVSFDAGWRMHCLPYDTAKDPWARWPESDDAGKAGAEAVLLFKLEVGEGVPWMEELRGHTFKDLHWIANDHIGPAEVRNKNLMKPGNAGGVIMRHPSIAWYEGLYFLTFPLGDDEPLPDHNFGLPRRGYRLVTTAEYWAMLEKRSLEPKETTDA